MKPKLIRFNSQSKINQVSLNSILSMNCIYVPLLMKQAQIECNI